MNWNDRGGRNLVSGVWRLGAVAVAMGVAAGCESSGEAYVEVGYAEAGYGAEEVVYEEVYVETDFVVVDPYDEYVEEVEVTWEYVDCGHEGEESAYYCEEHEYYADARFRKVKRDVSGGGDYDGGAGGGDRWLGFPFQQGGVRGCLGFSGGYRGSGWEPVARDPQGCVAAIVLMAGLRMSGSGDGGR